MYIKKIKISGYKQFKELEVELDKGLNILVGENGSGKTTILESIALVTTPRKNKNIHTMESYVNVENINYFKENPKIENLPKIYIELFFEETFDYKLVGANNSEKKVDESGLVFTYEFNDEYSELLLESIEGGNIPYEYYDMKWKTFQGSHYAFSPIKSIYVDHSETNKNGYNNYVRSLFENSIDDLEKNKKRNMFRETLNTFSGSHLQDLSYNKFGINTPVLNLDRSLTMVSDNGIYMEQWGKGEEILIKTEIALKNEFELLLMEEPENHLSHSNLRKMIEQIEALYSGKQIIISTHNNLITGGADLSKVIWIDKNHGVSSGLKQLNKDTVKYFSYLDNSSLLEFILSDKVILVEGKSEHILIPEFYKQHFGTTIEQDKIHVISCNGITFRRYLDVAEALSKKVLVLTDNDGDSSKLQKNRQDLNDVENIRIEFAENDANWTLEVCLYQLNTSFYDEKITVQKDAKYSFKGVSYINKQHLGYMLNNKIDAAIISRENIELLSIPEYITRGLEWIKN